MIDNSDVNILIYILNKIWKNVFVNKLVILK